ncbi:MAG TPA: cation diffusion facilitator family transporter [Nitrososphaerales archaeon]|nr:cation diffusion facilitator family transporter [Nitrososphaerales archaeon]
MDSSLEGFRVGQRIAKISVLTLAGIGVAEIIVGVASGSVVAIADGVDSFGDAAVSFIVWLGLMMSQRVADSKFQFGYHKIESFAALIAAIAMIGIGIFIVIHAWESLANPKQIQYSEITMITLGVAGVVSMHRAFQMRQIANKYKLLSLQTGAKNSIKDGSASIIGFFSVLTATYFGFIQMDAIGALAIAGFIFSVSYVAVRESSLILLDALRNPKLPEQIKAFVEKSHGVNVSTVLVRPMGPFLHGEINVRVEGTMTIDEFNDIAENVEETIKKKFPNIRKLVVTAEPKDDVQDSIK